MLRCLICNARSNSNQFLFKFPQDEATKIIWKVRLGIIGKTIFKCARVCSDHFSKQDTKNGKLRAGSLPNLVEYNDENNPLPSLDHQHGFNAPENMRSTKLDSVKSISIENLNDIEVMGIFHENEMGIFNNPTPKKKPSCISRRELFS